MPFDILHWLQTQPTALQPAYLAAFTQVGLFLLGFLTIAGTAWANRRNTLKAARDQQKLEIYKAILADIDAAARAQEAAASYVSSAVMMLKVQAEMIKTNPTWPNVSQRVSEFEALHYKQLSAMSKLHRFMEQWLIIDRRLAVFGRAFSYQHNQALQAGNQVSDALRSMLPTDIPDQPGAIFPYRVPQPRHIEQLSQIADRYQHESHLIGCYISDFNVELQPLLLGHLFGPKMVRRDPPDPTLFAIRLDRYRSITRYFENTPYFSDANSMDRKLREKHRRKNRPGWLKLLSTLLQRFRG